MRTSLGTTVLVLMLAACGSDGGDAAAPPAADDAAPAPAALPLDEAVLIDQVDVLQGTSASLVLDGARVTEKKLNAPVIAGRAAMLRVHAAGTKTQKHGKLPALTAELRIHYANKPEVTMTDGPRTIVDFDSADLQTTFDFDLPAEAITPDARIAVTLHDPKVADGPVVTLPGGTWLPLGARDKGTTLRVEFIPIRYDADGSGRLAPLDDKQVEAYKRALYKLYPVATVEATVRSTDLPWPIAVDARGTGWDQLLSAMMRLRRTDAVDDDVYYVGVFAPAPSIGQYCHGGCILGIAPAAQFWDLGLRVAMVVGFQGAPASDGTLAQELAHAMGRAHAPCGDPQYVDEAFPYPDASIGPAGWDVVKKEIVDPSLRRFDFMSYCGPVWTSDYTWKAIHARMEDVATEKMQLDHTLAKVERTLRTFTVTKSGEMTFGPEVPVHGDGLRDATAVVRYEDASGRALATSRAAFRPLSGPGGGILLAEEPPSGAVRARVEGIAGVRPLDLSRATAAALAR